MSNFEKLKRSFIREELVAITGDSNLAILLNQYICWSGYEHVDTGSEYYVCKIADNEGWITKKAEDVLNETMLSCSPKTLSRYLEQLTDKGLLLSRENPHNKFSRLKQHKVNFDKVKAELSKQGYRFMYVKS